MKERRGVVWILGAGFSKYLGAPLLNELLTDASLNRVRAIYREQPAVLNELRNAHGITEFFKWGTSDGRSYWRNAEEFLERLDHAAQDPVQARILSVPLSEFRALHEGEVTVAEFRRQIKEGFAYSLFSEESIEDLRLQALKLAAAEVSGFLEGADPNLERWAPYRTWASSLEQHDTVLTFNYDLVLETLNKVLTNKLRILGFNLPEPGGPWGAGVVKMHGSVDWYLQDPKGDKSWDKIARPSGTIVTANDFEKMALATPGPRKDALIQGAFKSLWAGAERAIAHAEALVFVGYRMPPTDAGTKQWFVHQLDNWLNSTPQGQGPVRTIQDVLPIHIVLGPRDDEGHAARLTKLFGSISERFHPVIWPMGAEDFLGLLTRERLLDYSVRYPRTLRQ